MYSEQTKDRSESKEGRDNSEQKRQMSDAELKKLSKDIIKSIKKGKKSQINFNFRINPVILAVSIFLIVFLSLGLFRSETNVEKSTFDEILRGIKEDKFSEIISQNDGKINAKSKTVIAYRSTEKLGEQVSESNLTEKSLDDFVQIVSEQNLGNQFRTLINPGRAQDILTDIIIGEDFLIGISLSKDNPGFVVLNLNKAEESFFELLQDKGIRANSIPTKILKIRNNISFVSKNSFDRRIASSQFSKVFQIGDTVYGQLKEDFVQSFFIDWNNNVSSFISTLQAENLPIDNKNLEIKPQNIPASISFGDILTILTLIGFGFLAFILFRGAQSSGMGISQFGQSKAKVFFGSKTDTTFKDVAGINEARDELNEIVEFLKEPAKFRKLGARIPKGVLMIGPPGTGKTLLARAIAGEAGVPFFHTSGSEFEEMLVGAGASRVRDLFAKAKKAAPALIFIDEIDAVARKRGTKIQSGNTEQTLNQILVEMDGFEKNTNLIILAATNRPDVLDPAILRPGRFDRQIRIELPDMEGRREILEVHGRNKPFGKDVDLEKIAKRTVGFTGADLENILNEAAILAARESKKEISLSDIEESVSKVVLGPAKRSRKRTEKELKLVAYHESGHAVVARFTPESTPVDKISIISRGGTGGVTMFLPEKDEYIMSKKKMLAEISVLLGGRAAEAVALDDISTGASNDIERATALARRMVQRFGMSDKLGLVQYGDFEENEYLGYAYSNSKEYSDKTAQIIDEEVKKIIDEAYASAIIILNKNRDKLDQLSQLLLEKEVVSRDDFDSLFMN